MVKPGICTKPNESFSADVERLANRICFICEGRIHKLGPLEDFQTYVEKVLVQYCEELSNIPRDFKKVAPCKYVLPITELERACAVGKITQVETLKQTLEDYFVSTARAAEPD